MTSRLLDEERIFHIARKITDREAQADYLDQVCVGDQALRERVEGLLKAHESERSLLQSNPAVEATASHTPVTEQPGAQIGRYKLLQKIGEGGFGVVFMAEQLRPVRRKVALKIIKPGMDTADVVARFEAERQALAMMDHPHIARVLDGGATDSGRPYFVMELVKGVPITHYCDKNQLSTDMRLRLFTDVCQSVQHAHQKGIIHRDLKPSNVLVTLADGTPIVKVIDFGVAKATDQQLTEKTLFTAYGQMIGTPQYMSPEQAEMSCLDIDTRSDVYSLGVLLYELLTGTTPLEAERLRTAGYVEMQRLIREEEPTKPSTRLSTSGEQLTVIAKHRSASPEKLKHQVAGDLDWIVMKALEKDRNRRYDSPSSLAEDVSNYLENEAVKARPPTFGYRMTKYVRRHRIALGVVGMLLLSLGAGLLGTGWQAKRARQSEQAALKEKREANLAKNAAITQSNRLRRQNYIAAMHWAKRAWDDNNLDGVISLLKLFPRLSPDRSSEFEWRYLWNLCRQGQEAKSIPPEGHNGRVRSLAISPNSRMMAVGYHNGQVSVWDLNSEQEIHVLRSPNRRRIIRGHHEWERPFLAFSPDEGMLAFPNSDNEGATLFDFETREFKVLAVGEIVVTTEFSPDGQYVMMGCGSGELFMWNVATQETVWSERKHAAGIRSISYSNENQRRLVTAGNDGVINIWYWSPNGCELQSSIQAGQLEVWRAIFSPDDRQIASAGMDGSIRLWDSQSGDLLNVLNSHSDEVRFLEYSPDGAVLASGSRDNTTIVWEVANYVPVRTLKGHSHNVECLAFRKTEKGYQLLTGSSDRTVKSWEVDQQDPAILRRSSTADLQAQVLRELATTDARVGSSIEDFALSHDGRVLAVKYYDLNAVDLWDLEKRELIERIEVEDYVTSISMSVKGQLAIGERGRISLVDPEHTGADWVTLEWHDDDVTALQFSISGAYLAIGNSVGRLAVWDLQAESTLSEFQGHVAAVTDLAFSLPNDEELASASDDENVRLWSMRTGEPVGTPFKHSDAVYCVTFSQKGKTLATAGADGRILLYNDWRTRREPTTVLKGHSDVIYELAISDDERTVFSACGDTTLKIWDSEMGQERFTLTGHRSSVLCLTLCPTGDLLVSGSRDGVIRLWSAPFPASLPKAIQWPVIQ